MTVDDSIADLKNFAKCSVSQENFEVTLEFQRIRQFLIEYVVASSSQQSFLQWK